MRGWLIVLFAAALASTVRAGKEPDLTNVRSDDGRFEVKFVVERRGRVPEEKMTVKTPAGPVVVNWMSASPNRDVTLTVHWTDLGSETDVSNPKKLFDATRDAAKGPKGDVLADEEVTLTVDRGEEKVPGREYSIQQKEKFVRYRVFLHDHRLYQITVAGAKKEVTAEWADKYLKSFAVLK